MEKHALDPAARLVEGTAWVCRPLLARQLLPHHQALAAAVGCSGTGSSRHVLFKKLFFSAKEGLLLDKAR